MRDAWERYGDLACLRVGARLLYVVAAPEHVQHVLITRRENYTKNAHRARPLIGFGLPASEGALWARQRKLLQPFFLARTMDGYFGPMRCAVDRAAARWRRFARRGLPVDLSDDALLIALDVITTALTGADLTDALAQLQGSIRVAVDYVSQRRHLVRVPAFLPSSRNLAFRRALAELDAFVASITADARAGSYPGSLIARWLELVDDGAMSAVQLRDEIVTLILAGHETSARSLAWTLYLLARHPDARDRLERELDERFADGPPTAAALRERSYLAQVVHESLRLYPPNWAFPREVAADDEIDGVRLLAGSAVMICPYYSHRHPDYWDRPDDFVPERFERGVASASRIKGAYYPFGVGPRTCTGNHFALLELQLALASLLRQFQAELVPGALITPEFAVALRPRGGLWMTVRPRGGA